MKDKCHGCIYYDQWLMECRLGRDKKDCSFLYNKVMDTACKDCLYYNNCIQMYKVRKLRLSSAYGTQVRK